MNPFNHIFLPIAAGLIVASCGSNPHWTLKGESPADADADIVIESLTFNGWQPIDTVRSDASGRFTAKGEPKGYPDIYRVRTASGQTVYFPVDSIETITMTSTPQSGTAWRVEGSTSARIITSADSAIAASVAANGVEATLTDSLLKRNLAGVMLADPASVGAYYLVNRRIGGKPLFDPARRYDLRMIGAVANAWNSERPGNPRSRELSDMYMAGRRMTSSSIPTDTLMAEAIGHFDITLYDNNGQQQSLTDVADKSRLTLLNFTAYGTDDSPAFNIMLNELYKRNHDAGLEIFQVSVDPDEVTWRRAAEALPWVTVYNPQATGSQILMKYMVNAVPTSFLIDADGEIVERIDDHTKLAEAIRRHI